MGRGLVPFIIDKKDVTEAFVRSSGPGGQNVNKTSTCVQLIHLPTGISVKCQESRRQDLNRKLAWELLNAKVAQLYQQKAAQKKAVREKLRRQNRRKSVSAKEKMLAQKKHRSSIKSKRGKVGHED